jgi:hypothetical protein
VAELATHPDAYRPRPRLIESWRGVLVPAIFIAVALSGRATGSTSMAVAVCAVAGAMIVWPVIRRWRAQPPVTIDEPGIRFGAAGDGSGSRLVPWESITGVVLFEIQRTDTSSRRWQPAIGVQLVGHPDGVSVQRPLAGWSLDRIALERAVARFGGGVPVSEGQRPNPELTQAQGSTEIRQALAEAERTAPAPGTTGGPRVEWNRTARYQPTDPAAYLARFDLRSNLSLIVLLLAAQVLFWAVLVPQAGLVGVLFAVVFAVPLVFIWRSLRSGGAVALAADRPGVFFGESISGGDDQAHRLVPWSQISAVVVYEQWSRSGDGEWKNAVGVRLRGEPARVGHWRIVSGWRFDRPALEAAVGYFAPGIPVVDGPPQRLPGASGVIRSIVESGSEPRDDEERRRPG